MRKTYDIDLLNLSKTLHKNINQNTNEKIKLSVIQESVAKGLGYSNFNHAIKNGKEKNDPKKETSPAKLNLRFYDEFWLSFPKPSLPNISEDILKNFKSIDLDLENKIDCIFIFTRNDFFIQNTFDFKKQKTLERLTDEQETFILIDFTSANKILFNNFELLPYSFNHDYLRYTYSIDHDLQINKLFNSGEYCFSELLKIALNIYTLSGKKRPIQNQLYLKSQLIINLFQLFYKENELLSKFKNCFKLDDLFNFYISDLDLVLSIDDIKKQVKGNEMYLYLKSIKDKKVDEQSIHNENMKNLIETKSIISHDFFVLLPYLLQKLNIEKSKMSSYLFLPKQL